MEKSQKAKRIVIIAIAFVCGWLGHFVYHTYAKHTDTETYSTPVRINSSDYKFTNPLLFIDNSKTQFNELNPLKNEITDYISSAQEKNTIKNASVYYRDLSTGKWTGVNEDDPFLPSSMLKVAVLMVYKHLSESNPSILNSKLHFHPPESYFGQHYPPVNKLSEGDYSVNDLLKQMIIESDNEAVDILSATKENDLMAFYKDLRLPMPPEKLHDYMSAVSFSTLFRTLYGSTYLDPTSSEDVLKLLSQTKFTKGLVSGVPDGTVVSHKFGEHTIYHTDLSIPTEYELHDCGIVYSPHNPYLICVMTKGKDFSELETVIKDISTIVYSHANKMNVYPYNSN